MVRVVAGGIHVFPEANYRVNPNTDFYAPPYNWPYHSLLFYNALNSTQIDDITWAPATATPEPGRVALIVFGTGRGAATFRCQRPRRPLQ